MTPVPRGPLRALGALAALSVVLALPAVASGREAPTCNGEEATHLVPPGGARFNGTAERDVIVGTDGPDVIYGLGGDDLICAGDGDDLVVAGRGNDEVYGEGGHDILFGNLGNDSLYGGDGNDQISGDEGRDLIEGGEGSDVIYGGGGPDTIYGGGGNDKLYGEAGEDRLFGGDGDDELQGGTEDDRLFGDAGDDYLWGDAGNDTLIGGLGDDLLQGGEGADNLQGRGGFDELWGGECSLSGVVKCRSAPSGRPPDKLLAADPGDLYTGGPGVDACNKSAALPAGCDTHRGSRGSGQLKTTSQEWWGQIEQAFNERALLLVGEEKVEIADALLAELEHAKQIVSCESLGDPFQMTPSPPPVGTTVDGLFQHKSNYWAGRAASAGFPGASVFDPLANARTAAWMVAVDIEENWDDPDRITDRLAWKDWACDEVLDLDLGIWEPAP